MSETSEVLRRAAGLMRERAEAATPGPWAWGGSGVGTHYWDGREEYPIAKTDWTTEHGLKREWMDRNRDNGQHIASWHPAVALAVADWLDNTAEDLEMQDPGGDLHKHWDMRVHINGDKALAVARAYLGADQ